MHDLADGKSSGDDEGGENCKDWIDLMEEMTRGAIPIGKVAKSVNRNVWMDCRMEEVLW